MAKDLGLIFETLNLCGFSKQTHGSMAQTFSSQLRLTSFIHSAWVSFEGLPGAKQMPLYINQCGWLLSKPQTQRFSVKEISF